MKNQGTRTLLVSSTTSDLLALALTGFLAVASSGCSEGDSEPGDLDGDGFTTEDGDCDDQNNLVYPGALESSGDALDSDCDDEVLPTMKLVWGAGAEENVVDAVKILDEDEDGLVSLAEFAAGCAQSSRISADAAPGIVQVHAACAGSNSCRGMVYQSWNEVYEHSCRGVNFCSGWSCVETAPDQGRTGEEAWEAATCGNCHSEYGDDEKPIPGVFKVQVPPSAADDVDAYVDEFWASRSDEYMRSIIAFGVSGVTGSDYASANMPGAHAILSRSEMDTLIDYVRTLEPVGHVFDPLATPEKPEAPAP